MSNNIKAHTVCEQLLSILKSSKLNYLVKETPYSAFITIRKRFVKDIQDTSDVTLVPGEDKNNDHNLKRENLVLKQRCKSLEVDVGFLKLDKENLELACETLGEENKCLRIEVDKIETDLNVANHEIHDKEEELERKKEESTDIQLGKDFLQVQLGKTRIKIEQMEKTLNEKKDDLEVIDNIVKNKDLEIVRLLSELDEAKLGPNTDAPTHACVQCDFTSECDNELKIHMGKSHGIKCPDCCETFAGEAKLKTHMCRLHIENPSSTHFYMKNWFIKNSCISVFSDIEEKEVAVLHSSDCIHKNPCSVFPPSLTHSIRVVDKNGLIHLNAFSFLKSGNVYWDMLETEIEAKQRKLVTN